MDSILWDKVFVLSVNWVTFNLIHTSPQWLKCLNYDNFFSDLWGAWFYSLIQYCFSFHYSLISFHQPWYIQGRGLSKKLLLKCILETFQRCLSYSPEKKIKVKFKIIPDSQWHLSFQCENSIKCFFIKICDWRLRGVIICSCLVTGLLPENHQNQSHHREMIVPWYWAKRWLLLPLALSSLLLLERKTQVLHSEAQWLISNKICKLFWK